MTREQLQQIERALVTLTATQEVKDALALLRSDAQGERGGLAERHLRYVESLEIHMDEGGKTAPNNVRDLIQMVRELAAAPSTPSPSDWEAGATQMQAACARYVLANGIPRRP